MLEEQHRQSSIGSIFGMGGSGEGSIQGIIQHARSGGRDDLSEASSMQLGLDQRDQAYSASAPRVDANSLASSRSGSRLEEADSLASGLTEAGARGEGGFAGYMAPSSHSSMASLALWSSTAFAVGAGQRAGMQLSQGSLGPRGSTRVMQISGPTTSLLLGDDTFGQFGPTGSQSMGSQEEEDDDGGISDLPDELF